MVYVTVAYYFATQKNEILSVMITRMEVEIVVLSKVSQAQKDKYYMISLLCGI